MLIRLLIAGMLALGSVTAIAEVTPNPEAMIQIIQDNGLHRADIAIVVVVSKECKKCNVVGESLARLQKEFPLQIFARIDLDAEKEAAAAFGVDTAPSTILIVRGMPIGLVEGYPPYPKLKELVKKLIRELSKNASI